VADREHRAADDGGDLLAMFSKQIVTEVGDRDQRKKPEPSNARTIRYFMAAATQEQSDEADWQYQRHEVSVKPLIGQQRG
jgi:hypothetical protein